MNKPSPTKIWIAQTRANFLILAILLAAIGLILAIDAGAKVQFLDVALLFVGTILAHVSVNLFNEYSDYKTKIDFDTPRNPFSGGSGMLVNGHTKPGSVLGAAIATLALATVIGVYFILNSHWSILLFIALGACAIIFYTNVLAKMLLGEFFAGLTLGTFVVWGAYIVLAAEPTTPLRELLTLKVIMVSIPPGILTSLLLLLNEFPDAEADKKGGRYHLIIAFGKKKSAYIYTIALAITYILIILTPIIGASSYWLLIALLTIPLASKAAKAALVHYNDNDIIIPALGVNVLVVLGTDLLLVLGVLLGNII